MGGAKARWRVLCVALLAVGSAHAAVVVGDPGSSPLNPIMPLNAATGAGNWTFGSFQLPAVQDEGLLLPAVQDAWGNPGAWFDPVLSLGFQYKMLLPALPAVQFGSFELPDGFTVDQFFCDGSVIPNPNGRPWGAGDSYNFGDGSVRVGGRFVLGDGSVRPGAEFSLLGIRRVTGGLIDENDPAVFPLLISFRGRGAAGPFQGDVFTQRALVPVPEPGSLALLAGGLLVVARRRRPR